VQSQAESSASPILSSKDEGDPPPPLVPGRFLLRAWCTSGWEEDLCKKAVAVGHPREIFLQLGSNCPTPASRRMSRCAAQVRSLIV